MGNFACTNRVTQDIVNDVVSTEIGKINEDILHLKNDIIKIFYNTNEEMNVKIDLLTEKLDSILNENSN